jgi:hypothetical protein
VRRPELDEAEDPVLLLTPGKVGTKTVAAALRSAGIEALAAHVFGPALLPSMRDQSRSLIEVRGKLLAGLRVDAELALARVYDGYKPRVASLVRDPIARAVSGFFQSYPPGRLAQLCEDRDADALVEEMSKPLAGAVPIAVRRAAAWYREQLPLATGVEVPRFRPGEDWSIFETDRARVLFMPLERIGTLAEALQAFVGRPVRVKPRNVTEAKHPALAGIRRRLEDGLVLDPAFVEAAYAEPVIRTVYDDETIAGFKARWL